MCCFVILLLSNEMQMSVRRFSAIPHLRAFRSGRLLSPDQEFSSHPCSSRKWFHLRGSSIQFAATANRSTKTLQRAPREANITRYSTNPALAAMLDFVT